MSLVCAQTVWVHARPTTLNRVSIDRCTKHRFVARMQQPPHRRDRSSQPQSAPQLHCSICEEDQRLDSRTDSSSLLFCGRVCRARETRLLQFVPHKYQPCAASRVVGHPQCKPHRGSCATPSSVSSQVGDLKGRACGIPRENCRSARCCSATWQRGSLSRETYSQPSRL